MKNDGWIEFKPEWRIFTNRKWWQFWKPKFTKSKSTSFYRIKGNTIEYRLNEKYEGFIFKKKV